MDPSYLTLDELDYELRLRKIHISSLDVFDKRKVLRKLLSRDSGRDLDYKDEFFEFDRDKVSIVNTITSIRQQLSELDQNAPDVGYKEIQSRLIHISNRVNNIPVTKATFATVGAFKSERLAECLLLDFDLDAKMSVSKSVENAQGEDLVSNNLKRESDDIKQVPSCFRTSKLTPIYKWGHVFYGDWSQSVGAFLERLEELREARGATKDDLFRSASDLFDKDARSWYRSVKGSNQVSNWDELVLLLRRDFSASDDDELWNGIRRRYQQPKERVIIYISNMEGLFNRLQTPPDESTKLQIIRKRLLPYFHIPLANREKDISSVDELRDVCRTLEGARFCESQDRTPSKNLSVLEPDLVPYLYSDVRGDVARVNAITCWNCKGAGHIRKDCPQARVKRCFTCGTEGYTKITCPVCREANGAGSKN